MIKHQEELSSRKSEMFYIYILLSMVCITLLVLVISVHMS
jgi:hypothetical protein